MKIIQINETKVQIRETIAKYNNLLKQFFNKSLYLYNMHRRDKF